MRRKIISIRINPLNDTRLLSKKRMPFHPEALTIGPGLCNLTCIHCIQGFGDNGFRKNYSLFSAERTVKEIDFAAKKGVKNISFGMGEPFIVKDWMLKAFGKAVNTDGIEFVNIDTNAFWAKTEEAAIDYLRIFEKNGVIPNAKFYNNRDKMQDEIAIKLSISVDYAHQKQIPLKNIVNAIKAFRKLYPDGVLTIQSADFADAKCEEELLIRLFDANLIKQTVDSEIELHNGKKGQLYRFTGSNGFLLFQKTPMVNTYEEQPKKIGFEFQSQPTLQMSDLDSKELFRGFVFGPFGKIYAQNRLVSYLHYPVGDTVAEGLANMEQNRFVVDIRRHGLVAVIGKLGLNEWVESELGKHTDVHVFFAEMLKVHSERIIEHYLK
jgi:organic radical activating enzyme